MSDVDITIRPMREADTDTILSNFKVQGWTKPRSVLEKYLEGQNKGSLFMFFAELNNDIAGYAVLYTDAAAGSFAYKKIPLVSDLIVFEKYQRRGIANKILDAAEEKAAEFSNRIHLGVGLHSGYGAAQRIYAKRGYIPDGSGVWYKDKPLEQYADCKNDDDLILYLIKEIL